MTDKPLVERLRALTVHRMGGMELSQEFRNPDGPEAIAEITKLREALEKIGQLQDDKVETAPRDVLEFMLINKAEIARAALSPPS